MKKGRKNKKKQEKEKKMMKNFANKCVIAKSTKCSLFSIQGNFSVNRKDLQASNLVGPTRENQVIDLLAVQQLDNQL